jgi:protein transport protein SEC20
MPPIPVRQPTFSDPEVTLSLSSLTRRQAHLSTSVIPNLLSLSPSTPLDTHQRLCTELREDLDEFGRRVEALEQLVEDLPSLKEREQGREVVSAWAEVLVGLKRDARSAMLVSKKNMDGFAKSRRDELLGSAVLARQQQQQQQHDDGNEKADDALMRTTAALTDALRRTEQRLRAELDRSTLSTHLLASQTATLRRTSDAHGRLSGLLKTSRGLITALERTDWLDRVLILGGLVVFSLACAWIVKVRVVDRAVGVAFWWVRFMQSLSGEEERMMDALERGATGAAESTLSTLASGVTSGLATAAAQTMSSVLGGAATLTSSVDVETAISRLGGAILDTSTSLSLPTRTQIKTMASILRDEL